jgi:hypothetical protein
VGHINFRGPPALGFADYGRIYHCEATLVAPHDSRTVEQCHDTQAPASFRHLPSSPSGLPRDGDGDGGELRRRSVCLGEVGEPAPSGARPRPSPLRLPPHRRLVGPVQSRKRRIPKVCAYYVSGPGIHGYPFGGVRSCRWSGRRMPFGSSAASSLLATVSWLTFYHVV